MSVCIRAILCCALVACKSTPQGEPSGAKGGETASPPKSVPAKAGAARRPSPPPKSYNLPSTKEELEALLPSATPERTTAIKGALRKLAGKGALSFQRTAVLGASLSAGFGGLPLGTAIDQAIEGEHQVVAPADLLFFKNPQRNGREHIDRALAAEASVIFAVDILFWYVYTGGDLERRRARLASALQELERIDVPLILGDIPDMRSGQPWMLPPEVIPPPEHLAVLNADLRQWARNRLNVHLVPLAKWSAALVADGEIEVGSGEDPVPAKSLIHIDGLHPNDKGVRYILLRIDAGLELGFPQTAPAALHFE